MLQFSDLTIETVVADRSEAMEPRYHFKNGDNFKRENFFRKLLLAVMLVFFSTIPAIAQKQSKETGIGEWLFAIVFLVLIILALIKRGHFSEKPKMRTERSKEYQRVFIDIFKNMGFSATDIIWTNCRYKAENQEVIKNILLGVKNETLSFFGGGTAPLVCETNGKMVIFKSVGAQVTKKLNEDYDLSLYDEETVSILFPKNDKYRFRHLFDIPIKKIEAIEAAKLGDVIKLIILCSDDLIKLTSSCSNEEMEIENLKIMVDVFGKIMTKGTLSNMEIYKTNDRILEIVMTDDRMDVKKLVKTIGKVAAFGTSIVIASAALGAYNYDRDRVLSQID